MANEINGETAPDPVGLLQLAGVFFKVGATGFGGAMPMLALIRGEVVERRHWVNQEDFSEAVVLGQILPGPVAVDAVTHIGHRLRGWRGAIVSVVAFILPSFLLMLGLTFLYLRYGQLPQLSGALKGLGAGVVALIGAAAYRMSKPLLRDWRALTLLTVAMLALLIFQVNVVLLVALAGIAGLVLYRGETGALPGVAGETRKEAKP